MRFSAPAAMSKELSAPDLVARFVEAFQQRYRELDKGDGVASDLEEEIRALEQRVRNGTEALMKMGWSESMALAVRAEEEKLARVRVRLADHRRTRPRTLLPPPHHRGLHPERSRGPGR